MRLGALMLALSVLTVIAAHLYAWYRVRKQDRQMKADQRYLDHLEKSMDWRSERW